MSSDHNDGMKSTTGRIRPSRDRTMWSRLLLGLFVSAVAIVLATRGVEWSDVGTELANAQYVWLVPATLAIIAGQWLRGLRWRVLFGRDPSPTTTEAFLILSVGYLVSAILPMRPGDPVRAWLVGTRTQADGAQAFAAVLAERMLDLFTIAIMLALWLPEMGARLLASELGPGFWERPSLIRWGTLAVVAIVYFIAAAISRSAPVVARMVGGNSLARLAGRFIGGFRSLSELRSASIAGALSIAIWILGASGYWAVMRAFDLELGFWVAVFAMCATAVLAIIPSSPGYVGVFHYAVQISLSIAAGVPEHTALAYAVVLHALTIGVLVIIGVVALWALGLSWSGVTSRARAAVSETSAV